MALMGKNLPINAVEVRDAVRSLSREDPWSRTLQSAPVFLPGESYGWRGLVGYSVWDCKELDTTKQLTHTHTEPSPNTVTSGVRV